MSLAATLKSALRTIPDCLAVGYIDMANGILLDARYAPDADATTTVTLFETMAISIANLFDGDGIGACHQLMEAGQSGEKTDGFSEIVIYSDNYLHVFQRSDEFPGHVVCYMCRETANPGLVLTKSQLSLSAISAAI